MDLHTESWIIDSDNTQRDETLEETVKQVVPERIWKDQDVYDYFKYSFTCLPIEKAVELCKRWWSVYTGMSSDSFFSLSACMALHLVDPIKKGGYLIDLAPVTITFDEQSARLENKQSTSTAQLEGTQSTSTAQLEDTQSTSTAQLQDTQSTSTVQLEDTQSTSRALPQDKSSTPTCLQEGKLSVSTSQPNDQQSISSALLEDKQSTYSACLERKQSASMFLLQEQQSSLTIQPKNVTTTNTPEDKQPVTNILPDDKDSSTSYVEPISLLVDQMEEKRPETSDIQQDKKEGSTTLAEAKESELRDNVPKDKVPATITLPAEKKLVKLLNSITPGEEDSLNEGPVKCNDSNASDQANILKFNNWYNSLSQVSKVAFTAFLAAAVFRAVVKNKESVKRYIRTSLMNDFVKLYRRKSNGLMVPLPSDKYLDQLPSQILEVTGVKNGVFCLELVGELNTMVFSRYLAVYKSVQSNFTYKTTKSLLELVILNSAAANGLKLVTLALDAAKVLKVEVQEMLNELRRILPDEYAETFDILSKFISSTSESVLWPWCRILDDKYHSKFQVKDNTDLAIIFAGILGPKGDEAIWKFKSLDQEVMEKYKNTFLSVSKHLRKKYCGDE